MSNVVSIRGYRLHIHDGQATVNDLDLANRLEYAEPRSIRKLIKRMLEKGQLKRGTVWDTVSQTPGGGRPSTAYHLSEKAALKVIVKSETEKADQITDEMIDVFMEFRNGAAGAASVPQTLPEALRLAADLAEERDNAVRTKAEIGSRREATAMATASAERRRANKLQEELGVASNWKTAKSITWLHDEFDLSGRKNPAYSQIGKKLTAISNEIGVEIREVEDSAYGKVKAYHLDAINELHSRINSDPGLLAKYRKNKQENAA